MATRDDAPRSGVYSKEYGWPLPPDAAARLAARRRRLRVEDRSVSLGDVIAEVMAELEGYVVEDDRRDG
jgi:hypothetical protein